MSATEPKHGRKRPDALRLAPCLDRTRQALLVCDLLETLADDLPSRPSKPWRTAQMQCRSVLRPYFTFVHDTVLPRLLLQTGQDVDRKEVLSRLRWDCNDQLHALNDLDELITDALFDDRFAQEPDALGYALRCYFEALRRDLHWQLDVLWPLAARIRPAADAFESWPAPHKVVH